VETVERERKGFCREERERDFAEEREGSPEMEDDD
jgi:hypothetical protein